VVVTDSYKKFYHADFFSLSTFCCSIIFGLIIILPFFIVFATKNFWLSAEVEYEQALVAYRYEAIIYTLNNGINQGYSNMRDLNQLMTNNILSPTIKTYFDDTNQDGKPDTFHAYVSFRGETSTLEKTELFFFFDYGFRTILRLQMQDYIRIEIPSPFGLSRANVFGDLMFKQLAPLPASSITNANYNSSMFSDPDANVNIFETMLNNTNKTEFLYGDYDYLVTPSNGLNEDKTEIFITLKIPPFQPVKHIPSVLENFKFSWIQYISILVPTVWIGHKLLTFLFKNNIFNPISVSNFDDNLSR